MATVDDIATRVNDYRNALKKQVDEAAADITQEGFSGGGAFNWDGGVDATDLFTNLELPLNRQRQAYQNFISGRVRDRVPTRPDPLSTVSTSFTTTTNYSATDYNTDIVPEQGKNLSGWASEDVESFTEERWKHDGITASDIAHINTLAIDTQTQLDMAQTGWEKAQFDLNAAIDLEGAKLGARGFRRANSWLKQQQLNLMRKFSDSYHDLSKKVATAVLARLQENLKSATQLLGSREAGNIAYNEGYATVYDLVAKAFFEVKGLANSVTIESWKYGENIDLEKRQVELKRTLALQAAAVTLQVDLFKAKAAAAIGQWDAEVKRITAELTVESENSQNDIAAQKLLADGILYKIDIIHNATKAMLALDKSQYSQKVNGLIGSFEEYLKMLGSSNQNALGVATGKG